MCVPCFGSQETPAWPEERRQGGRGGGEEEEDDDEVSWHGGMRSWQATSCFGAVEVELRFVFVRELLVSLAMFRHKGPE